MRIVHWTERYRPSLGGVEILTERLIEALAGRGHQNFVVTSHTGADLPDIEQRGAATVHRFRFQHALAARDGAAITTLRRGVSELLAALAPDVLHLHTLQPSLFFHEMAGRGPWPTVLTVHEPLPSPDRETLASRTLARADAVVAISEAGLAALRSRMPATDARSSLIVNGLPFPVQADRASDPIPLVVAAARLEPEKGMDVLLRAMALVLARHPSSRLVIAGDGRQRGSLIALARELGIDAAVEFAGWCSPADVEVLLGRASIVVVPSRWQEPFGLVALQAGQLARPVVACAVGALPEIVADGATGVLVPAEDPAAMGAAIAGLLDDPQRAAAMGAAARERVATRYSMDAMVDAYERLYARLTGQRSQPRQASAPRPLVIWEGLQSAYNSLAYCNTACCDALLQTGDVDLRIVSNQRWWTDLETRPELQRLRELDVAVAGLRLREAMTRPSVWVRHQFPPRATAPGRFPWVVMQPWEYSLAPQAMVDVLNRCREVWTASRFGAEAFRRSGVTTHVEVIPMGVDPDVFTPQGEPFELADDGAFRFLFVGPAIHRKGIDVLLAAYARAFERDDPVTLVIKDVGAGSVYAEQNTSARIEAFASDASHARVIHIDACLPQSSLAALYRSCHVYVAPYRGEGFCLPVLEAMASGLPVIVTDGGATDDFVDEAVGWRIPSRPRSTGRTVYGQPARDEVFLLEPDTEALAVLMRRCFENPADSRRKGETAGQRSRASWTWSHTAQLMVARVHALLGTSGD